MEQRPITLTTPEELADLVLRSVREGLKELNGSISAVSEKKLLSAKNVENEYGIPERTLEYWRRAGIGPVYTAVGRRVFYERAVLEDYLISGRITSNGWAE